MIEVEFIADENKKTIGLKVTGHAGQAEKGKDIICSSASILMYTVAQYAMFAYKTHYLKRNPAIELNEGNSQVLMIPKKEHFADAKRMLFFASIGYTLLAKTYPEYVKFVNQLE